MRVAWLNGIRIAEASKALQRVQEHIRGGELLGMGAMPTFRVDGHWAGP